MSSSLPMQAAMDFFTRASENKLKKRKGKNQTIVRLENCMYNRNCTTVHMYNMLVVYMYRYVHDR